MPWNQVFSSETLCWNPRTGAGTTNRKIAVKTDHACGGGPLPSPDQIGKHRHRKNLDRGGERKHASRHPRPLVLQQPEPVQHHRQQHEVRLAEIEHVEDEGNRGKTRQREQPRAGCPARSRHRAGELRRHPPRDRVQERKARIEKQLAEISGYRQQNRGQRRIDEFEIGSGIAGIEIAAVKDLLAGPEPERIILGFPVPQNFRTEHVGRQRDTADQKQDIDRSSQRRVSQHTQAFRRIRGR